MNTNHLSAWEQEEYILEQRTPQMMRHLSECARCRKEVENLEQGIADFRATALRWSAENLVERPQRPLPVPPARWFDPRWAFAALIPVLMLILMLAPFHSASRPSSMGNMSDDALLDQVDEQVSVSVPSSMESLTHLVSTGSPASVPAQ